MGPGSSRTVAQSVSAQDQQPLFLTYPPEVHQTIAEQIFLIGTAAPGGDVWVNGEAIERNSAGHFAPSFPLELGENEFTLRYGDQSKTVVVTRLATTPALPDGVAFVEDSLAPTVDVARLPEELICFEAIAPSSATVSVSLGSQTLALSPTPLDVALPPNYAVLNFNNQPLASEQDGAAISSYQGCGLFSTPGTLGTPTYRMVLAGQTVEASAAGRVEILSPTDFQQVTVTADSGTARTGPSTNYSRLTPLPTGTQALVTGREGDWYRMDYGAWIRNTKVEVQDVAVPPRSLIRSAQMRQGSDRTEILFPLQVPVPITVSQGTDTFSLTLHNTMAQTDTIFLNDDPLIERLDWTQPEPHLVTYDFKLKTDQQWGYDLRYEGTTLVLALYHPPHLTSGLLGGTQPLRGMEILVDPGHGGDELGARGPNGYPEKDVVLDVSLLLRDELERRGATVIMTREEDMTVSLGDRVSLIQSSEPHLALSVHYNALPDDGDAINTAGIGMFWYNTQAHDPAIFLHQYLVDNLNRPSYGVFWNNLALTRPTTAPAVLLELGFMINPDEFEWIMDPAEQARLVATLADGIVEWTLGQ